MSDKGGIKGDLEDTNIGEKRQGENAINAGREYRNGRYAEKDVFSIPPAYGRRYNTAAF